MAFRFIHPVLKFKVHVSFHISDPISECQNSAKAQLLLRSGRSNQLAPGCKLTCSKVASELATCKTVQGDRTLTNILYFIFRMLATMCLACNFVLLHAQTIQMCKVEEDRGNPGALGKFDRNIEVVITQPIKTSAKIV